MNMNELSVMNKPLVCPTIVGRTIELAALHTMVEEVMRGQSRIVLLSGEAGIGKSRLASETKTYAASKGLLLIEGQCFPTDRSCPYAPLLDLMRSHFASQSVTEIAKELKPFAHELAQLIPDLIPPLPDAAPMPPFAPLEPEQEKRRLFEALTRWFTGMAAKQPVLLIIEDLHWSDETSLDLLHYLARRCAASPMLIVLTYRSDEVLPSLSQFLAQLNRERLAQECSLIPLTQSEVSAMLYAIFELRRSVFTMPPLAQSDLLDALYSLTEGNPFFVEELLKSLIEAGDIFYEHGRWEHKELGELHLPRTIADAVERRTAQLSEAARQVLNLAAVAGRYFDFALLQALTVVDEAQLLRLTQGVDGGPTRRRGVGGTVCISTRTDAASRLCATPGARAQSVAPHGLPITFERLYASSIEAHLADLAFHYTLAGSWEQALYYGQRAGEQAQALYAPRAAIEHFTQALDAAHQLSLTPSVSLYRARGLAYETLGYFERARADQEPALAVGPRRFRSVRGMAGVARPGLAVGGTRLRPKWRLLPASTCPCPHPRRSGCPGP